MFLRRRSLLFALSAFAFCSLFIAVIVVSAPSSSPECRLIDSILRPGGLYFTRLCDSGHWVDIHGPLVAIRRTLNNKPDGDVSRVGVNLTPAELHRLSCLVKCHEAYNTTALRI
jgi:hypothetical protein